MKMIFMKPAFVSEVSLSPDSYRIWN